ncbi:MAG: FlgO family outer membrane protein, partial [bacterium]
TDTGQVKIVDFGLAKLAGRTMLTKEGTTLGTAAYMSPEQAQGAKVDDRADIWALGTVLYEMISGRQPFAGDYEQAVVYSIMNEEAEPMTGLRTGVPMELERIVGKALAKSPDERYQQVNDLLVDLKNLQKSTQTRKSTIGPQATAKAKPRSFSLVAGGIATLLVAALMFWWFRGKEPASPVAVEEQDRKIAVLPFVNITADPEQEYFCDGMTEQLITNLSRVPVLKVIARTSVMRYKNTEKDIRQISKELDAKYVLEGSVRKSDRQVRITAQLIEADEGTHLWANDYDRELQDIFAIQDDVSQSIAQALEVAFSAQATKMVKSSYSTNVEAYEAHLKTRYFIDNVYMKTRQETYFQQALEMARRTVELDPDHYLGYFDLGYLYEVHWTVTGDPGDMNLERKYVREAYRLNPELPETNAAIGYQFFRTAEYDSAFPYMKAALALDANTWEPFHLMGVNLSWIGLYRQAIRFYDKAVELNPFSIYTISNRGSTWLLVGEVDLALKDMTRAYQIQPDWVYNLSVYAFTLILKKQYQQADSLLQLGERQPPGAFNAALKFSRALYFVALGKKEKALALSRWPGVLAKLGMKEEAIAAIDQTTKNQGAGYYLLSYLPLRHLPIYDNLRDEPEFQNIVRREREKYEERQEKYSLSETN